MTQRHLDFNRLMLLRTYLLAHGPHLTSFATSIVLLNPNRQLLKVLPVDLPVRPWHWAVLRLANRTLSPVVDRFVECAREVTRTMIEKRQVGRA